MFTIETLVEDTGYAVESTQTERLSVPDMDCASCAGKVESALSAKSGVRSIDTRPTSGVVVVEYDSTETTTGGLIAAIEGAGYAVDRREADDGESIFRTHRAYTTAIGAVMLVTGVLFEWIVPSLNVVFAEVWLWTIAPDWIAYTLGAIVAGAAILRNGYYSARTRQLDIDLLMSAGILGAFAVGLPFEAATLATLYSVAELLERYSIDRARNSLEELIELSPDTATVDRDGEEVTVPVEEIEVGETVLVRPGETVPIDGQVIAGQSALDESAVTGESVPVDKTLGDEVYAGSQNTSGYIEIETTAPAGESTLATVIDLVADAEAEKTERERFVDRFAAIYTPIIVV